VNERNTKKTAYEGIVQEVDKVSKSTRRKREEKGNGKALVREGKFSWGE